MQRLNVGVLYRIGGAVHPLTELTYDPTRHLNAIMFGLIDSWDLLQMIVESPITSICKPAAIKLLKSIDDAYAPLKVPGADLSAGEVPIDQEVFYRLTGAAREFEIVLLAELQQADTYFVSQKGIYSTFDLIERADSIFSRDVQASLPEQARFDFTQAGKCLAFELPTAAGFHTMRAIESVIRAYHAALTSSDVDEKDRNWNRYIELLKASGADEGIVSYLHYIRKNHRNPVLHPATNLTFDEANALFSAALNAIVPMVTAIRRLTPASDTDV